MPPPSAIQGNPQRSTLLDAIFNGAKAVSNIQGETPEPGKNICGDRDKGWNANCGLKGIENKKPSKPGQDSFVKVKSPPSSNISSEIPEPPAGYIRVFDQGHNHGQVLSYQDFISGKGLAGGIRPESRNQYFKEVMNGSADRVIYLHPQ